MDTTQPSDEARFRLSDIGEAGKLRFTLKEDEQLPGVRLALFAVMGVEYIAPPCTTEEATGEYVFGLLNLFVSEEKVVKRTGDLEGVPRQLRLPTSTFLEPTGQVTFEGTRSLFPEAVSYTQEEWAPFTLTYTGLIVY